MATDVISAPVLKPGIYPDVSFERYCAWDAANSHTLNVFAKTPMHVRHAMLSGEGEPTRAKDRGWLAHLAVLEPERFEASVAVPPNVRKQGKRNLEIWAQWQAENADKIEVKQAELDQIRRMRDAVLSHPTAGEFFRSPGAAEVSIVWDEREAGVRCKARIDRIGRIGEYSIIGDLKTAADAGKRAFEASIYRFGYHVQAAHYTAGIDALMPMPASNYSRRFLFFVVESAPPHAVAVYELDDLAQAAGERTRQRYLSQWRQCIKSGVWPGYGDGVDYVSIPAWAAKVWNSEGD